MVATTLTDSRVERERLQEVYPPRSLVAAPEPRRAASARGWLDRGNSRGLTEETPCLQNDLLLRLYMMKSGGEC